SLPLSLISLSRSFFLFFLLPPPQPISTLFPYTTLFRSTNQLRPQVQMIDSFIGDLDIEVNEFSVNGNKTELKTAPQKPSRPVGPDRKSTRLNSSHVSISYAVFCLKKKKTINITAMQTEH